MTGFPVSSLVPPPGPDERIREWWAATERRELLVQRCQACRAAQHYPRAVCTNCGATGLVFEVGSGEATLYSYTTVFRSPHRDFEAPYVIALVRLAEGPLVLSRVVGTAEETLRCDQALILAWEVLEDGRALPVFTVPARDRAGTDA